MDLAHMTWTQVAALDRGTPVVLPIAALEQHGHHMPVFTDSLLLGEILRRVKETAVASQVLFAPLMWWGNSHHHMDMPGTMSAPPRLYLDLLPRIGGKLPGSRFPENRARQWAWREHDTLSAGRLELRQNSRERTDLLLAALTYWECAAPRASSPSLSQESMGHACEWKTEISALRRHVPSIPD